MSELFRTMALVFALMLAGTAWPQERDEAKADALFREGRALMKKGNFAAACPKLEESQRLDPAPGTAVNLGDCYEKQGRVASALLAYQAARDSLAAGDPRMVPVKQQIAMLEKRAPRLTIRLTPGAPEGTEVERDGRVVDATKLGVPVVVNPGTHVITVMAPGRQLARYRVALVEGQQRDLVVEAGGRVAERQARDESEPPPDKRATLAALTPEGSSKRGIGYVFGGVGLLGAVIAVPTYLYVSGKAKDARDGKAGAEEDGKSAAPIFYASSGVAVVGLAVGGYLLLTSSDDAQTAVALHASQAGVSAALQGRF
jgi:hypothetical protein